MQSPPASADATRVSSFVSRIGPTRRISQIDMAVHQSTQFQMMGQGDRKQQSGIDRQAVVIKGDMDVVGPLRW